ncbi:type-F conjugative transfer system secretin TraK [Sulfuricystis multivorans]|uniref:type-F conjugative transfer system secretin TraK n=1 Tax=Sulfuricystis multivorans TaxID=2211108 RepID=UPI000F83C2B7|nr:type-F conjugative transfer system secretin TraK [Sulfuricystis multivorans]
MVIKKLLFAATAVVVSFNTLALQEVNPVEGQNAFVKISAKETTRLYIDGGKIRTLIATDGELTVEKDEDRGQLFIRPAILNKPINVRVIAGSGATYNLVMQPVDIPQEDIVIKEPSTFRTTENSKGKRRSSSNLEKQVRNLVASMALEEPPTSVEMRVTHQEFALWENTRFVMTAVYNGRDLVGEKYVLTNTGKTPMRLVEQELYRKGVVAVAIENMLLEAGQSTTIYVVRSN